MSLLLARVSESDSVVKGFSDEINEKSVLMMNQRSVYKKDLLVVDLNPTLPPIYLLGFISLPIFVLFWLPGLSISAFFLLTYVLFMEGFHFWAMKKGLRKKGYQGEIKRMKQDELLRVMLFDSG